MAAQGHAQCDGELHVVLGLLAVDAEGLVLQPSAIDVVVGRYIEVEHAAQVQAHGGPDHPAVVVQGLTAPLLQAGARSIVATGWLIGDRATLRLIDAFYAEMARGLPNGEALRAAKLQILHEGRPTGEWAAFTLVGDPSIRIPLRRPRMSALYWLPAAAVLLIGIVYGVRRRRRESGGEG